MNEAIKALKAGDRKTAYRQLRRHLRSNPKDIQAWLWISQATTDPKKQIDALKQVLRLEPNHPKSKAIHRRIRQLENSKVKAVRVEPVPSSSSDDSDEHEFDELLAEVRAELQRHRAEKEAKQKKLLSDQASLLQDDAQNELEISAQNGRLNGTSHAVKAESKALSTPLQANLKNEQENGVSAEDSFNENGIDLILELKKSIEEKQQNRIKKKEAPIKSAMKVAAPAVGQTTSPPISPLPRAEKTAVDMEPKSSNRKGLVLWMVGVLLLSVLVVVGVVFIIPNLPLSN